MLNSCQFLMLPLLGVSVGMTFLFVIAIAFSCILFLQTKAVQQSFLSAVARLL
ncbi:hypothetical protein [Nostoc sp. GT001]|uniref:hypothetical protein n=1 Tax=Nostoc sp. GT001 TaxID=3056647 RepID=UPI0025AA4D33|nr:hypothetical protein [Nostoc sp. GT001]MDM9586120.1 hypothetical protein [Nostoc sp. GT001]